MTQCDHGKSHNSVSHNGSFCVQYDTGPHPPAAPVGFDERKWLDDPWDEVIHEVRGPSSFILLYCISAPNQSSLLSLLLFNWRRVCTCVQCGRKTSQCTFGSRQVDQVTISAIHVVLTSVLLCGLALKARFMPKIKRVLVSSFVAFLKLMVILNFFPTCLIWLSGGDMLALIWPFLVLCKKKDKGYSHICLGSLFLPLPSPPPPLLPTPARTHTHTLTNTEECKSSP